MRADGVGHPVDPSLPRVVGRAPELERIHGLVDLPSGGAGVLLLHGPPGMGKSILWEHGVTVLAARVRVLTSRPVELTRTVAFGGLGELLEGCDRERAGLEADERRVLEQTLSASAGRRSALDRGDVAVSLTAVLRRIDSPAVLAIDDLQWLDPASASVLRFALRRLGPRLGVLATARSPALSPPLDAVGRDRADVLDLRPLRADEVDTLIRTRLGTSPRRELLAVIHERSGGNPMFALELARELLCGTGRSADPEPHRLPSSLRHLVDRRVAAVPRDCADALLVVAAAAAPTVELVEQVLGRAAVAAVQRAVDERIVRQRSGVLRFTHPLMGAAAYEGATPGRRRRIHRRLAELSPDAEERARQLAAAADLPDTAAAGGIESGARAAWRRGAPETAAGLALRAADLTPDTERAAWRRRLVTAADYAHEAGDDERCDRLLERVATAVPPGPERGWVLRRIATRRAQRDSWGDCVAVLDEALRESGGDDRLTTTLLRDRAFAVMQSGDVQAAGAVAEAARVASADGFEEDRADAQVVWLLQATIRGHVDPSAMGPRLDALAARETTDRWMPSGSRLVLVGTIAKWLDDFPRARAVLERAYRRQWQNQQDGTLTPALFQLAELEVWAGRYAQADALNAVAEETQHRARSAGTARAMRLHPVALLAARRGDLACAEALAAEQQQLAARTGDTRNVVRALGVLGFVALSRGRVEDAARILGEAHGLQQRHGYDHPAVLRTAADHVEALVAQGDLELADRRLEELIRQAQRTGSPWATHVGLRCAALVALARDEKDTSIRLLARAISDEGAQPDPFETARTRLALGAVLRRSRRRGQARDTLATAAAAFADLGVTVWLERARDELARTAGPRHQSLTPTQTAVAELVALGRTNKEVAAELYLSVKTVEAHLTAIYRDLGVSSRTALTSYLLTHGMPTGKQPSDVTDVPPARRGG